MKFKNGWRDMKDAPKKQENNEYVGPWILGIDGFDKQRVMRWTTEYPCREGTWMFAYTPTNYIDEIQYFTPIAWQKLPKGMKE